MKEKYINVNGLNIAYIERGQKCDVSPLIFIHGWLDNAASFSQLAPLINHPHTIAIDLIGHGHSDHLPPACYYHFIDGVSQIVELLRALEIKRCTFISHSLGACIASILAGGMPKMVDKLILLDAIGPLTAPCGEAANKYHTYLKQFQALKKKPNRFYQSTHDACHHRGTNGYLSAGLVAYIVQRGLKETPQGFEWRHDPKLLLPSPLKMTEAQTLSFLKEIQAPTLLINAANGFKIDEAHYEKRLAAVPQLQLETLNCGHHLHIEQPQACAKIINDFIGNCIGP